MRIIRPSEAPKPYRSECDGCKALLEVDKNDCRYVNDPRDGDAYVFVCPCCKKENWIDARILSDRNWR